MYPTPLTSPDPVNAPRNGAARLPQMQSLGGRPAEPGAPGRSGTSPRIEPSRAPVTGARSHVFFSGKGGDGKTWLTANCGALIAWVLGRSVLIIDNDMNSGRQALHFDLSPIEQTLYYLAVDFAAAHRLDESLLRRRVMSVGSIGGGASPEGGQLDLLPGIRDITEATRPELTGAAGQTFLTEVVRVAASLYDVVLIDSGSQPYLGAHAGALMAADRVLFINSTDRTSLIPNRQVMESVARDFRIPRSRITLVINRYNPVDDINLNDVERLMGIPVSVQIHEDISRTAISSVNHGVPFAIEYLQHKATHNKHTDKCFDGLVQLCDEIAPGFHAALKARGSNGFRWNPFVRYGR